MTIQETRAHKMELLESMTSLIDRFQKKTGLTVEEINISHIGRSGEDQVKVQAKTYLN